MNKISSSLDISKLLRRVSVNLLVPFKNILLFFVERHFGMGPVGYSGIAMK